MMLFFRYPIFVTQNRKDPYISGLQIPNNGVTNIRLKNLIEQNLYKPTSTYGNGSVADAIRYEKTTAIPVEGRWHTQAGEDARNSLINNYDSFSMEEKRIADAIYNDISNALKGD